MAFAFLTKDEVLRFHAKGIEELGGSHGLRDEGALESALLAAENRAYYEEASLAVCVATYAYHLTQAHAFIDALMATSGLVRSLPSFFLSSMMLS